MRQSFVWLERFWQDVRYGSRMLVRNPGFTVVAVISLTIGIGANAAIFSFADAILLRPLTVPRPAEVMTIGAEASIPGFLSASYRDYVDVRDRTRSFEGLAAFANVNVGIATDSDALPNVSRAMLVSGNFFPAMGVVPVLGRAFRLDEDQAPGRDAVVVLGHDFWERQLGGNRTVIGSTVRLNGIAFTVIGVAPAGFTGLDQFIQTDLYAPLMMWPRLVTESGNQPLEARDFRNLNIRGRLAPGVSISQAQAELSTIAAVLERAYPETNRNRGLTVRSELTARIAQAPPTAVLLTMLMMLAVAVLLVACANVAGLLASRAPARSREIALRLAVGAGRSRLVRQLITESVLIAIVGGSFGVAVAYAGLSLLGIMQIPTDVPLKVTFELDRRALLISLAVSLVSAVVFGLLPAMRSTRADLTTVMKASDTAGDGRRRRWGRPLLVAGQVAIAVVLLVVATFIYRGFQQQIGNGPGYRTDHVLMMRFDPRMVRYSEAQTQQFFQQVAERVRLVPGVKSAALVSLIPMDGFSPVSIVPEGFELPAGTESVNISGVTIDEQYFETMGLPILKGRGILATDSAGTPRVAIVNEQLAQRYWPGQDPLGKRFRLDDSRGPWVSVVGVAKAAKYNFMIESPRAFLYLPYKQRFLPRMTLLAESVGDPASLVGPLREVVRGLDANLPISNLRTMEEFFQLRVIAQLDLVARLIATMGIMGLALAIVGLYGLVAYAASRRTREIGIRMAIGAGRFEVLRMVLRQAMGLAVAGLGVGLLASAGAARAMGAVFPGGPRGDGTTDLVAFPLIGAIVLAVTLFAAFVPARRASRVNPTEALRYE